MPDENQLGGFNARRQRWHKIPVEQSRHQAVGRLQDEQAVAYLKSTGRIASCAGIYESSGVRLLFLCHGEAYSAAGSVFSRHLRPSPKLLGEDMDQLKAERRGLFEVHGARKSDAVVTECQMIHFVRSP